MTVEINKLKYTNSTYSGKKKLQWFAVVMFFLLFSTEILFSQVRVPFTIRTSAASPLQKNYSINGDFAFIGNTNLTLVNYDVSTNNNNNAMQYVDIDNDQLTWNSSSADLNFAQENGSQNACTTIIYAGLYWTGRTSPDGAAHSPNEFSVTKTIAGTQITKDFNKKKILFKGPNSVNYTEFQAQENAIYYPNNSDAFIYSAYTEVTDYVRLHGTGAYFAADLALVEGNGSGTGFSGGWGLVVIYENSKMKHRDITVFDGHAFVLNSTSNGYNLEVDGFNTLQTGNIGAKMGIMASEGDVSLSGDYFQIQKNSDLTFTNLHHDLNSNDNFFNSSNTTLNRNPMLVNNTGIDISTFSIPNENNVIFGNNQTSTNFRYGTIGDTYAIFALVLAVDSYLPKVENTISVTAINSIPTIANTQALPGQDIEFNIAIRNTEHEPISNFEIVVPMPHNATFIDGSAQGIYTSNGLIAAQDSIYFDPAIGSNGALIWRYGTLPFPENPNTVLANLKFKIKTTDDCFLLKSDHCVNAIEINGYSKGTGSISGVSFASCPFILGKNFNGICTGDLIKGPLRIPIDATNFVQTSCQNSDDVLKFSYCNGENSVPLAQILSHFPLNSLIFNSFPITDNSVAYSNLQSLPLQTGGTLNYFAIPQNLGSECVYRFSLSKCSEIVATSDYGNTISNSIGGIAFTNILNNDSINGQQASLTQVSLTIISAPVIGITLNGLNINVAAGTNPGNYTITYQICDLNDLSKCEQANVTFTVTSTQIDAQDDRYEVECPSVNIIGNILRNDILNGLSFSAEEVDIISETNSPIAINAETGEIFTTVELTSGIYELQYQISPKGQPTIFDSASIIVTVTDNASPVEPLLNDIVAYCSINVEIPTTTDSCSGVIIGATNDPLFYNVPGEYMIHWTFTDNNSNSTQVNQRVEVKNNEDTIPGYGYVDCNLDNDSSLNIDLNSYLSEGINRNGNWTSNTNTTNLNGAIFSPYQAPIGNYQFQYLYSDEDCIQTVSVNIEVNNNCFVAPACNLLVHNSFSPNNDGINEVFMIENIDQTNCFPSNSVEIYNRWGVLVFKTTQYDNVSRVFTGTSEGRATVNESKQLPTGTYYYIIKYKDINAIEKEQVGYLYLVM